MDPNPFKHPAIILKRLRLAVEPSLLAAGFRFEGRNKPNRPIYLYLDYSRDRELFRLAWDRRESNHFIGFTAELASGPEGYRTIVAQDLSGIARPPKKLVTAEVQTRIEAFASEVVAILKNPAGPDLSD